MKKSVMKMWVAALRSGKYKQGEGMLRSSDNHFCCLGVLCDLHRRETGDGRWRKGTYYDEESGCHYEVATRAVVRWAGLNAPNPALPEEHFENETLAQLNDANVEFSAIADMIEEYWRNI